MLVFVTRARHPVRPPRSLAPVLVFVAALDLTGVAGFTLAAQLGRVDVSAVLSSMYPVVTIVLAAVVLHERLGRLQLAGIVLAMAAIALIGSG
jgi:drug/metabolite transporter (DMT)-like permease